MKTEWLGHKIITIYKCMKYYKVEIVKKTTYTLDVVVEDDHTQASVSDDAMRQFNEESNAGTLHFKETGDPYVFIGYVYDVTGTDDAEDDPNVCPKLGECGENAGE